MTTIQRLEPPYAAIILTGTGIVASLDSNPVLLGSLPIRIGVQFDVSGSPATGLFADTDVNGTANTIAIATHGYTTGLKVTYNVLTGVTVTNLTDTNAYYVIRVNANSIKLAASLSDALANTAIDIEPGVGGTFNLVPATLSVVKTTYGTNDDVEDPTATINWISVDANTSGVSYLYSNAVPCFKFLKVNATPAGGSQGNVTVVLHTKL
jgi:hypothetical protein